MVNLNNKKYTVIAFIIIILAIALIYQVFNTSEKKSYYGPYYTLESIPEYSNSPYVVLNNNVPKFTENDITEIGYEYYSDLDEYKRSQVAYAVVGVETMPTENRMSNGQIKPSGWHTVKYDIVDGGYLYNRCHLIGYQLTGENKNENNLITGTRYMNVKGMLKFENQVADYITTTKNHVMYRTTPIYSGDNLLANGVQIEAKAIEDKHFYFNVYVYNVQPGIVIDYRSGDSYLKK